jgi:hypothetical protein
MAIFEKFWEIFSGRLTTQHAEQEITDRERRVGEIELLLSSSAWELREFENSVPRTAVSVIDFWNSATGGKAVLILDALSLRESPWLLQEAERRGYHIQQAGVRGSEIPSDTTSFAEALKFGQRSSIENNGAGLAHHLPGARTESLNIAWQDCLDWIASAPAIVLWHHWQIVFTNWPSRVTVSKSSVEKLRNNSPLIRFGQWLNAWPQAADWLSPAITDMPRPACSRTLPTKSRRAGSRQISEAAVSQMDPEQPTIGRRRFRYVCRPRITPLNSPSVGANGEARADIRHWRTADCHYSK